MSNDTQKCSKCKMLRSNPTEFTRRDKVWKTCNHCSDRVKKQTEPSEVDPNQSVELFFIHFDHSNLNDQDYEVYCSLRYRYDKLKTYQDDLNNKVYSFYNMIMNET